MGLVALSVRMMREREKEHIYIQGVWRNRIYTGCLQIHIVHKYVSVCGCVGVCYGFV